MVERSFGEARGVAVTSRRGAPSPEPRRAEDPRRARRSAGGGAIGVAERGGPSLERGEGATAREKHAGVVRGGEGDVVTLTARGKSPAANASSPRSADPARASRRRRRRRVGARRGGGGRTRVVVVERRQRREPTRDGCSCARCTAEPRDVLVGMKRPGERAVRATRIRFRRPRRDAERGARGFAGHRRVRVTGTRAARRHRGTEGRAKGVAPRRVRGIGRVAPLGNARPPPAREASAGRSW